MKEIKVEWCRNWIKALFKKAHCVGFETNEFWRRAIKSGLYEVGTYGTPMSHALEELTTVETVNAKDGSYLYSAFRLKEPYQFTWKISGQDLQDFVVVAPSFDAALKQAKRINSGYCRGCVIKD